MIPLESGRSRQSPHIKSVLRRKDRIRKGRYADSAPVYIHIYIHIRKHIHTYRYLTHSDHSEGVNSNDTNVCTDVCTQTRTHANIFRCIAYPFRRPHGSG